jgi:uncharacterized phage infection (PIP) family protein YhgE
VVIDAPTPSGRVDLGQTVVKALRTSRGVTQRLDGQIAALQQAKADMDRGAAYATVVTPSTFSASALLTAGDGGSEDSGLVDGRYFNRRA